MKHDHAELPLRRDFTSRGKGERMAHLDHHPPPAADAEDARTRGRHATSARGFFAAGGGIPWFVNGIAFAGDYLSAASFLGICGMIAFSGYDGFLYSIGYLAGWVVALFVIAEPLKR